MAKPVSKKEEKKRIDQLTELGAVLNSEESTYVIEDKRVCSVEDVQYSSEGNWIAIVDGAKIPFVESENVSQELTGVSYEIQVQNAIKTEVVKLKTNSDEIVEFKTKYFEIVIADINDKENIKAAKEAKKILRTARTTLEKNRKTAKEFYVTIGKGIDEKAKEYEAGIVEVETAIDVQLKKLEEWEAAEELRKEQEAQRVINERIDKLKEAGMVFNGSFYVVGDTMSMDVTSIKAMNDTDFGYFYQKVVIAKKKLDEDEAERIAKEAEEQRKRDEQQKEIDAENDRLKKIADEQREAQRKMDEEREQFRRDKLQMREQMAVTAGLHFDPSTIAYIFSNKYTKQSITKADMEAMEAADYKAKIDQVGKEVAEAKGKQQEDEQAEIKKQAQLAARADELKGMGLTFYKGDYHLSEAGAQIVVENEDIHTANIEEWKELIASTKQHIAEFWDKDKAQKEEQEALRVAAQKLFDQRAGALSGLGMTGGNYVFEKKNQFGESVTVSVDRVKDLDETGWMEYYKEVVKDIEALAQSEADKIREAEEQRQRALPEIERVQEYMDKITATEPPMVEGEKIADILLKLTTTISHALLAAGKEIEALKI